MFSPQYGQSLKSGRSIFPQDGHTIVKSSFSSSMCICFFRLPTSLLVFSIVSFIGVMSLTSARIFRIRSLTCARISLSDSIVSYIRSNISLLLSKIWVSVWVWVFASERTLLRNSSTGLSTAMRQVMAQSATVAAADA